MMEIEVRQAITLLAELPTTGETPGVARDDKLDELIGVARQVKATLPRWINVYLTDRAYGGPEEGGWWYDTGKLISSDEVIVDRLETFHAEKLAWCEDENGQRRSDISSVLSEGRYVAIIEDEPGADYPATRPCYE